MVKRMAEAVVRRQAAQPDAERRHDHGGVEFQQKGGIAADDDDAETGRPARAGLEGRDARRQILPDLTRGRVPIENACCHRKTVWPDGRSSSRVYRADVPRSLL